MRSQQLSWRQEAFSSFISGGLPMFLTYGIGGEELLESVMKGLLVNDWLLYYSSICAIIALAIAFFDYRFDFKSERTEKIINGLSASLMDSLSNFISIFKVTSGLLCSFAILWLLFDFQFKDSPNIMFLAYVGIAAGVCSFQVTKVQNYTKSAWLKKHTD